MPPVVGRLAGARVYTLLYGGCAWHTVVASHRIVNPNNPFLFSEGRDLALPAFEIDEIRKINLAPQVLFASPPR